MAAPDRLAVNEKIAAAMAADVSERDRLESRALAGGHVANKSGTPAPALGLVGIASINVASSSLARELFTRFEGEPIAHTS